MKYDLILSSPFLFDSIRYQWVRLQANQADSIYMCRFFHRIMMELGFEKVKKLFSVFARISIKRSNADLNRIKIRIDKIQANIAH